MSILEKLLFAFAILSFFKTQSIAATGTVVSVSAEVATRYTFKTSSLGNKFLAPAKTSDDTQKIIDELKKIDVLNNGSTKSFDDIMMKLLERSYIAQSPSSENLFLDLQAATDYDF